MSETDIKPAAAASGSRPQGKAPRKPAAAAPPASLPRRDIFLLPLLSLLTVIVLLVAAEIAAGYFFAESGRETCEVSDPVLGTKMRPNCVSHRKAAEGPEVENAYNDCGYRTRASCGPRPAGTLRAATIGSSTTEGLKVRYDDIFTTRAGALLSQWCGRPVEFQNMGVAGLSLLDMYQRAAPALALKPDLVMLAFGPFDMEEPDDPERIAARQHPETITQSVKPAVPVAPAAPPTFRIRVQWLLGDLMDWASDSHALLAARHFLFQDRTTYAKLYLGYGDKADYLRRPFTPAWEKRFAELDLLLGEMAEKFAAVKVPFILVVVPHEAQAALAGLPNLPPKVDPELFSQRVAEIARKHSILMLDTVADFGRVARPDKLFYPVDGHINGAGHELVGVAIAKRLVDGDIPAFASCKAGPVS